MRIWAQGTDLPGKIWKSIAGSSRTWLFPDVEGEICPSQTQKSSCASWQQEQREGKTKIKRQTHFIPQSKWLRSLTFDKCQLWKWKARQDNRTNGMWVEITTSEVKTLSCNILRSNRPDNLYFGAGFMRIFFFNLYFLNKHLVGMCWTSQNRKTSWS